MNIFDSTPLDTIDISQELLNITNKYRSNIFSWRGQFSPQLIEVLISKYARRYDVLLDPFLGCGTVLYEAGLLKHEAYGSEINPSAYKLSSIYQFINYDEGRRNRLIQSLEISISRLLETSFTLSERPTKALDKQLKHYLINIFKSIDNQDEKAVIEALIILLDFHKNDLTIKKIYDIFSALKNIILSLPYSDRKVEAFNHDARNLPMNNNTVDLVITSPPYINVFNYHQNYRRSVEALGWDVLKVAKSEIGSNRRNRGNRFLTVIEYCIDMAQSLYEISRVLKKSGRMIFVVGRTSNIKNTPFYNGQVIAQLGVKCIGLNFNKRQERVFKNQFGQLIYEDIIHFAASPQTQDNFELLNKAKQIAKETLNMSLDYAPLEETELINKAILKADEMNPSPIYEPNGDAYRNLKTICRRNHEISKSTL